MRIFVILLALLCGGCSVWERGEILVCEGHGGIKSWHGESPHLEVTCEDGTIFNVDWI